MKIGIFGSTGSVGAQTLDVVRDNRDKFETVFLSAHQNTDKLFLQAEEFLPAYIAVTDDALSKDARAAFERKIRSIKTPNGGYNPVIVYGSKYCGELFYGGKNITSMKLAVIAVTGLSGLLPAYNCINSGIDIALANKETLVAGGGRLMAAAKTRGTDIIPVDSEHSAIRECLNGNKKDDVRRLILTASGGPFAGYKKERLKSVTAADALKHPIWKMGKKVTLDSATLMNKGLEIIEAMRLFDMQADKIDVVIHPESVVHSMVEYEDNTTMAMLSVPDMRVSISRALGHMRRIKNSAERLDLTKVGSLTFGRPDTEAFPCLDIARGAAKDGGIMPAVMNAANERAVEDFFRGKIGFCDIPLRIERVMKKTVNFEPKNIDEIFEADAAAKRLYGELS
jgi:1-deoxy-D-xylulose-5-phosphate reductoisomerase